MSRRQLGIAARALVTAGAAAALTGCGTRDNTPATRSPGSAGPSGTEVSGQPLGYTVTINKPGAARGYVFFVSGTSAADPGTGSRPALLVIADKTGKVVWQREMPSGQTTGNLRVQRYQGKPVLTWWQGVNNGGHGSGTSYIVDEHYNVISTLMPSADLSSDIHEFRLTPDGRALITSYPEVTADLTAVGGPRDGKMYNCTACVVDVASKTLLFQWDALSHVPVSESTGRYVAGKVFDPYHMNSISLDPAGNLVISMRAVSTVFNVDPRTGAINWRLGGTHSTFELGDGVQFAFQHDAQMPDASTVTLFDNHVDGDPGARGGSSTPSSLKWIHLDPGTGRADLIRALIHRGNPTALSADAMGNLQQLQGGNTFSGWGTAEHITEFTPDGDIVYDATLRNGTYRAFLDEWVGDPVEPPQLSFTDNDAHAVWNGATRVSRWRLLYGAQSNAMTPLIDVAWAGYDTTIPLRAQPGGYYQLQALDAGGAVLNQVPPVAR